MSDLMGLKKEVFEANMLLPKYGIVYFTWGNVSVYDNERELIAIKPSGVPYDQLCADDIVVLDMNGNMVEGKYNPSSDLQTHLEIYKNFDSISAIVHTHSMWACGWAQSGKDIICLGTTHADCFYGSIPCTRSLTDKEIQENYEQNTGKVIVDTFVQRKIDPIATPGVIVKNHGPFVWAQTARKAVENAVTLEVIAQMNSISLSVNPDANPVGTVLLNKHYYRKHGKDAYYGQK